MTRGTTTVPVSKCKAPTQPSTSAKSRAYSFRGSTIKSSLQITPTKTSPSKLSENKSLSSPNPSTPSNRKCSVCQGIDDLRSMKLNEAVQEFSSKLDTYQELSKSLGENSSNLSHAITTIKHFILHLEPSHVENFFTSIDSKISSVSDSLADLSNYVTKLDDIHMLTGTTHRLMVDSKSNRSESDTKSFDAIDSRIQNLESICAQLSTKIESFDISPLLQYQERFNNIIENSAPTNPHHSSQEHPLEPSTSATQRIPKSNTVLIIGDSNTKYVNLNFPSVRVPTYLIEDIDPTKCIGYHKIWVHIGINNLKSRNCRGHNDIVRHFNLFMHKLYLIRQNCPHSKIVVSPVLPNGIQALNERALIFNKMLFSRVKVTGETIST